MKALDLFCGAGGASMGLHRAGFEVVGVDINPQPHYPFQFIRADALKPPVKFSSFDFIWSSPPCQAYSMASQTQRNLGVSYPDLVEPTRQMLESSGKPYAIENVPGSPLRPHIFICGCQVGLPIRRLRWFETSWNAFSLQRSCNHNKPVVSVVGHGTPTWVRKKLGLPPPYSELIGRMWLRNGRS